MRILLTRNTVHNMLMQRDLKKHLNIDGLQVCEVPLLEQVPVSQAIDSLIAFLGDREIDEVIFISPSSVEFGYEKVLEWVDVERIFAVGKGTANMLQARLSKMPQRLQKINVIYPQQGVGSQALLKLAELQEVKGKEVLIVTGAQGKPYLEDTLIEKGAKVSRWECYIRQKPRSLSNDLNEAFALNGTKDNEKTYVFLHSAHAASYFIEELPANIDVSSLRFIVGAKAIADELHFKGYQSEILLADSPMPKDMLSRLQSAIDELN